MILSAGKALYKGPSIGLFESAAVDIAGILYALIQISHEEMARIKKRPEQASVRAVPTVIALHDDSMFEVWPTPDKPYAFVGRFYPPLEEF